MKWPIVAKRLLLELVVRVLIPLASAWAAVELGSPPDAAPLAGLVGALAPLNRQSGS